MYLPIEDRIALYDALDKLSAFQRRLIYLLFFKQLTQSEVADELGLTQKKASRESIKAFGRLQQLLGRRVFWAPPMTRTRLARGRPALAFEARRFCGPEG